MILKRFLCNVRATSFTCNVGSPLSLGTDIALTVWNGSCFARYIGVQR